MSKARPIVKYHVNPKRDKQYDDALREHLRTTWKLPGRTHTQIAKALGVGNPSKDKTYGLAIMYALHDFAENDSDTICWYPNLRLKEKDLQKKREKSKHNDYGLKLYKHASYRKLIDRDLGHTDEIVGRVILGFLKACGTQSGHAIQEAMRMKLGHIASSVVERCLKALIGVKDVTEERVNKTLTLYHYSA